MKSANNDTADLIRTDFNREMSPKSIMKSINNE